jgi:hypothetical protein
MRRAVPVFAEGALAFKIVYRTIFPEASEPVDGLLGLRPQIFTFGKLGESTFQLDCKSLPILGQCQKRGFKLWIRAAIASSAQCTACLRYSLWSPATTSPQSSDATVRKSSGAPNQSSAREFVPIFHAVIHYTLCWQPPPAAETLDRVAAVVLGEH